MNTESNTATQDAIKSASPTPRLKKNRPQTTHSCTECEFTAKTKLLIKKHMILKHPEKIQNEVVCKYCSKIFKDSIQLENHLNVHTGNKPYKCSECELCFSTNGELVRHMRYKHTLEKPHKCDVCDYKTVEKSKLKRHQRTHTNERPYICPFCDYASRDTFKLKRHLRVHTGEKPYQCPTCGSSFTQSNSLKVHMKNHGKSKRAPKAKSVDQSKNKPDIPTNSSSTQISDETSVYECKECTMKFTCQARLDEHSIEHTGERPHVCDECGMKFARTSTLRFHKLSHNEEHTRDLKERLKSINNKTKFVNKTILKLGDNEEIIDDSSSSDSSPPKRKRSSSSNDSTNECDDPTSQSKKKKLSEN